MKPFALPAALAFSALLFTGCLGLSIGGGTKAENHKATLGQQLIDLQKARDVGAISDADYQIQKEKLLHQ